MPSLETAVALLNQPLGVAIVSGLIILGITTLYQERQKETDREIEERRFSQNKSINSVRLINELIPHISDFPSPKANFCVSMLLILSDDAKYNEKLLDLLRKYIQDLSYRIREKTGLERAEQAESLMEALKITGIVSSSSILKFQLPERVHLFNDELADTERLKAKVRSEGIAVVGGYFISPGTFDEIRYFSNKDQELAMKLGQFYTETYGPEITPRLYSNRTGYDGGIPERTDRAVELIFGISTDPNTKRIGAIGNI